MGLRPALGAAALALTALLAACGHTPPTAIGPVQAPPLPAQTLSAVDCGPAATLPCARPQDALPALVGDAADLARLLRAADELLFAGDEQAAWAQLDRALKIDARHAPALQYLVQITDDPRLLLGEPGDSHVMRPGETLRQLAAARLGDARWFYLLARYNGIAVPREVAEGRAIRLPQRGQVAWRPRDPASSAPAARGVATPAIPASTVAAGATAGAGTAAGIHIPAGSLAGNLDALPPTGAGLPAQPAPGTSSTGEGEALLRRAQVAEKAGRVEQAYAFAMRSLALGQPGAREKAATLRAAMISRYKREARAQVDRQNLGGAIKAWRNVLELDPADADASSELRKLEKRRDSR